MVVDSFDALKLEVASAVKMSTVSGIGLVSWFNAARGFGFIKQTDACAEEGSLADVFVHESDIFMTGFRTLEEGAVVEFITGAVPVDGALRAQRVTGPNGSQLHGPPRGKDRHTALRLAKAAAVAEAMAGGQCGPRRGPVQQDGGDDSGSGNGAAAATARAAEMSATVGQAHELLTCHPRWQSNTGPCRLGFLLVVDGPLTDRPEGVASWVEPDCSYRKRRDALVRCLLATLSDNCAQDSSASTCCWLLFEAQRVLMRLSPEFLFAIGQEPDLPQGDHARDCCLTEQEVLEKIDAAVQLVVRTTDLEGRGSNPCAGPFSSGVEMISPCKGLDAFISFKSVTECASFALCHWQQQQNHLLQAVVVELHDNVQWKLPVYDDHAGVTDLALLVVLGCVLDHLDSVKVVTDVASSAAFPVCRVNVGPVADFSSNIIHVARAYHAEGRFLPAVAALLVQMQNRNQDRTGPAVHEQEKDARECGEVALLHFWVPQPQFTADEINFEGLGLPALQESCDSAEDGRNAHTSQKQDPVPRPSTRDWRQRRRRSCVLQHMLVSSLAKSHGFYNLNRLSFIFGGESGDVETQGRPATLTAGCSLLQTHLPRRGWGACTEHHLLHAMLDAARSEKHCLQTGNRTDGEPCPLASFACAVKFWGLNLAVKDLLHRHSTQALSQAALQQTGEMGGGSAAVKTMTQIERQNEAKMLRRAQGRPTVCPEALSAVCMVLIVDPVDAELPELPVYARRPPSLAAASEAAAPVTPGRVHVVFASEGGVCTTAALMRAIPAQMPVHVCRLRHLYHAGAGVGAGRGPSMVLARAIASVQAHNNNGALWPAVQQAFRCKSDPPPFQQ